MKRSVAGFGFGLAAFAGCAMAQPNVQLSDILSINSYTGTDTTRVAYVIGSHTCNLGNQELAWINDGTPGLGMNMYRLHGGRLMQIGLGNVKTACCAGDQNNALCGTCGASGSGLGPGCLDVYSAGFNAGQGALAPRSFINAYTGAFTTFPQTTGDGLFRRTQVLKSDIANFTGALFFAEGVYVADDETVAQHGNNASYKRVTLAAASPHTATIAGNMTAGVPAIRAWRDHGGGVGIVDPSVGIGQVTVPSEGTYWYAVKVTNNNNGTWTYDYAVFNLDSHISGASFSVPVPAGVTVTGAGFNSPDYHSGEVYSNTDWAFTRNTSDVTWASTQTFAQNANANALRWGTMFNFWFTANTPPTSAAPTLGFFRPFTPSSIQMMGQGPSAPACDAIDFNNDTSLFDPQDIDAFLSVYSEGPCIPSTATCNDIDFNNDTSTFDPCDIDSFLTVFAEGPCTPCGA